MNPVTIKNVMVARKIVCVCFFGLCMGIVVGTASAQLLPENQAAAIIAQLKKNSAENTTPPNQEAKPNATLPQRITNQLTGILESSPLAGTQTAIYVVDANSGQPVYSHNIDLKLNPASNVKLLSTVAALTELGKDFHYTTAIMGAKPVDGSIYSDVFFKGDNSPQLTIANLQAMAKSLASSGVSTVHGDLLIDNTHNAEKLHHRYQDIRIRGGAIGEPPTLVTALPCSDTKIKITAQTKRVRKNHILAVAKPKTGSSSPFDILVSGVVAPNRVTTKQVRIFGREQYTACVLRTALHQVGVEIQGQVRRASYQSFLYSFGSAFYVERLATHRSETTGELLAKINKRSINWLADWLVNIAASRKYASRPRMGNGLRLMRDWLREETNHSPREMVVDTGSGLSYKTRMSTRHIVNITRTAAGYAETLPSWDPKVFIHSLAIAGVDGTLRRRFRSSPLKQRVLGKTGTLNQVVSLSGIVLRKNENNYVFSIITNGHKNNLRTSVRVAHEKIIEVLDRVPLSRQLTLAATTPARVVK